MDVDRAALHRHRARESELARPVIARTSSGYTARDAASPSPVPVIPRGES
jgi:hypothetical protein